MDESQYDNIIDLLTEIAARERMHTQLLMSIAYKDADNQRFQIEMDTMESKIRQLKEYLKNER